MIEPVVIPEARGAGDEAGAGDHPDRPDRPDHQESAEPFPLTAWGHRGYEQDAVDRHVAALTQRNAIMHERVAAREGEVDDLRRELDRLHHYIRQEWHAATRSEATGRSGATTPATGPIALQPLLAEAQEVAAARLAEGERRLREATASATRKVEDADTRAIRLLERAHDEATGLVEAAERRAAQRLEAAETMAEQALSRAWHEADRSRERAESAARQAVDRVRRRYQEIVVRAHQRADQAAEHSLHELELEAENASDPGVARAQMQLRASYLATSAQISRTARRAALALAEREFARLLDGEPVQPPGVTLRTVIDLTDGADDPHDVAETDEPKGVSPDAVTGEIQRVEG